MDKRENIVFLSLGSNIGDRAHYLNEAVELIIDRIGFVVKSSSIYKTEGWGAQKLNYFHNMIVKVSTFLNAFELLQEIQEIERLIGREKKTIEWYENRVIDVDLLFYNETVIETDKLIVPHKEIQHRKFVLLPMCEIEPYFTHSKLNKTILELVFLTKDKGECIKLS